ncbi:hypothetical protein SAMN05660666_02474 [Novosphingobium aromaticivorans]|uniref:hypothetical protein n=1 Tax=Novosphingobium aromaticivorans TaxID=48935 RepID=UPI00087740D4|nr:hypothetical protein [Novosphingobium aromaticivorans]SCY68759.1 hypothetical protein SAMN05660666_02474 [Novosphingobium aromaticivorans]
MSTPETTPVELKPCPNPWCVSTTAPLPIKSTYSDDAWRVRCACGVVTHRQDTEAEAIAAWNTRHRTQPLADHRALVEALEVFRSFGCPVCNGDCSGANPPVMTCPMQMSWKALAALKETDNG